MQTQIMLGRTACSMILALVLAVFTSSARAGGGNVLPATAKPRGYSLSDMAKATAFFNTTMFTRTPAAAPDTPFQIRDGQDYADLPQRVVLPFSTWQLPSATRSGTNQLVTQ
jgi:hypothetical protein